MLCCALWLAILCKGTTEYVFQFGSFTQELETSFDLGGGHSVSSGQWVSCAPEEQAINKIQAVVASSCEQQRQDEVSDEYQSRQNAQKNREANSVLKGFKGFDEELGHGALRAGRCRKEILPAHVGTIGQII